MKSRELIQIFVTEIGDLHRRGEYTKGYSRAIEAVSLCEQTAIESETRRHVSILAARSAYYVSRFDEALALCSAAESILGERELPSRHRYFFECAIVRANVFRRQGKLREALAVLEPYGGASAGNVPQALVSEKLLVEGACRFYLNELRRAEESLEAALGLAINNGDSRMKSRVLTMLGLVAQNKGLHEAALEYFERAKDICRLNSDNYGEAAAALNAGILLCRRGEFSIAATSIERSRAIFASIEWKIGECRSLLALGNVSKCRGDFAAAVRFYRDAGRIAGEGRFAREQALAAEFTGDIHLERGRSQAAEACYVEARGTAASVAPEGDVVIGIDRRLGELLLSRGDVAAALPLLRRGLRLSQRLGDKLEKGAILRCMGKAAFALGAGARGCALFRKAIAALRAAGCDFELGKTHLAYAELLVGNGNSSGGDALRAPSGIDQALDEAWASAVEAEHIFGTVDGETLKAAAGHCIERVIARRGRRYHVDPVLHGGRNVVKIGFSPAFIQHEGFVAVSEAMLKLCGQIRFAAEFDRPVLVTGETGTGKELVARLVHLMSPRARHPFVALNCAAVPDHLFESEFFGHRRGCFTGAMTDRIGLFEEADGGTLFLDEIGELTTLQQVKLLRVLQEGRIRRIGDNGERPVDVRVISATNQDLEERLGKAAMREDFYYRINAEQIVVPALRERPEDIVPLIAYCLCRNGNGQKVVRLEQSALKALQRYPWPGNVRELFAVLDRVKHISNGDIVTLEMLPARIKETNGASELRAARLRREVVSEPVQRLRRALDLCGGNKSAAARWLGISRGTLYKELRRSGLLDSFHTPPAQ
jgi:transcriptional regulator with AAA-type ATPase domain/tetratricopeptide (TPR) repeat protein